jgi:hypothetical protein
VMRCALSRHASQSPHPATCDESSDGSTPSGSSSSSAEIASRASEQSMVYWSTERLR